MFRNCRIGEGHVCSRNYASQGTGHGAPTRPIMCGIVRHYRTKLVMQSHRKRVGLLGWGLQWCTIYYGQWLGICLVVSCHLMHGSVWLSSMCNLVATKEPTCSMANMSLTIAFSRVCRGSCGAVVPSRGAVSCVQNHGRLRHPMICTLCICQTRPPSPSSWASHKLSHRGASWHGLKNMVCPHSKYSLRSMHG